MDLVLISSVINISNNPLSYIGIRSVYNKYERFQQTLLTIKSLEKIENKKILFVEASDIPEFENEIIGMVDYYKNIYKDDNIKSIIDGLHKSLGESTSILEGIGDMDLSPYNNIYKISGRYWLNDRFDYSLWNNNNTILFEDERYDRNIVTVFYKVNNRQYTEWLLILKNISDDVDVRGIEAIFKEKMKNYLRIKCIGVAGYWSINGNYWEA